MSNGDERAGTGSAPRDGRALDLPDVRALDDVGEPLVALDSDRALHSHPRLDVLHRQSGGLDARQGEAGTARRHDTQLEASDSQPSHRDALRGSREVVHERPSGHTLLLDGLPAETTEDDVSAMSSLIWMAYN